MNGQGNLNFKLNFCDKKVLVIIQDRLITKLFLKNSGYINQFIGFAVEIKFFSEKEVGDQIFKKTL